MIAITNPTINNRNIAVPRIPKQIKNTIHQMFANKSTLSIMERLDINRRKKRSTVIDLDDNRGKSLEWNLQFQDYLKDIEDNIGMEIQTSQKKLIKTALTTKKYYKLSPQLKKKHRSTYSRKRKQIIADWETNTGKKWTTYDKPLFSKKGKLVREAGQYYDAHHIILCSWGGNNEWWNFVPAKFPDEHQQGIHRKGGKCSKIFGEGGS